MWFSRRASPSRRQNRAIQLAENRVAEAVEADENQPAATGRCEGVETVHAGPGAEVLSVEAKTVGMEAEAAGGGVVMRNSAETSSPAAATVGLSLRGGEGNREQCGDGENEVFHGNYLDFEEMRIGIVAER